MRAAAVLAVVLVIATVAWGDDGGVTTRTKDDFSVNNNQINYQATDSSGPKKDRLNYRVDALTGNGLVAGLRVKYDYRSKTADTNAGLAFKFFVYRIVEFDPTSSTTPTSSNIKQSFILGSTKTSATIPTTAVGTNGWNNFVQNTPTSPTESSWSISTVSTNPKFTVTGKWSTVKTSALDPNNLKLDFVIDNFPWTTTGTKLAIEMRVAARTKFIQKGAGTSSSQLMCQNVTNVGGVNALTNFNYPLTATVSASTTTVPVVILPVADIVSGDSDYDNANTDAGDNQYRVWAVIDSTDHTFTKYDWDPSVGADYSAASHNAFNALMVLAMIAVAALATTVM